MGIVTFTWAGHIDAGLWYRSCGCGHLPPLLHRFGAELTKRAAGDQMALRVEGVVNGGMGGQKSLR
jgi:hypothetical protein